METHDYKLFPCAGSQGWYEIKAPVTVPGIWVSVKISDRHSDIKQLPPYTRMLAVGCGKVA